MSGCARRLCLLLLLSSVLMLLSGCTVSADTIAPQGNEEPEPYDWLHEPFREAFPRLQGVESEINVLRFAPHGQDAPSYFAWLALDRMNGLAVLFVPEGDDGHTPAHILERPVEGVTFDSPTQSLVLAVREASGTGISQVWFDVLRCVGGEWSSVWRGIGHSHMDAPGPQYMERRGGVLLGEDPVSSDFLLIHHTVSRWYSTAAGPNGVEETHVFEELETYRWDSELVRFTPDDGSDAGRGMLVLDRPRTLAGPSLVVHVSQAAGDADEEMRVQLVCVGGDVPSSVACTAGGHAFLPVPRDLEPGEYRVQLVAVRSEDVLAEVPLEVAAHDAGG